MLTILNKSTPLPTPYLCPHFMTSTHRFWFSCLQVQWFPLSADGDCVFLPWTGERRTKQIWQRSMQIFSSGSESSLGEFMTRRHKFEFRFSLYSYRQHQIQICTLRNWLNSLRTWASCGAHVVNVVCSLPNLVVVKGERGLMCLR